MSADPVMTDSPRDAQGATRKQGSFPEMEDIFRAVHETVLDFGPKQLASKIGTGHTSLLNRANPNDDTHRISLELTLQILKHSCDLRALAAICAEFDCDLVPKDKAKPKQLPAALIGMNKEVADVTTVVAEALEDGRVTQTEKAAIKREIAHARHSLDVLEESVKAA